MNTHDYQFNLTPWFFYGKRQNAKNKAHFTCYIMFISKRLISCFKSISVNRIYVAQWDKLD